MNDPSMNDGARAKQTRKRTRIQQANEQRILDAALEIFSSFGFRGATVDQIAGAAGMSKPNLLYYFRRKQDIYLAVLTRTLEMWLEPFGEIDPAGDPAAEISAYIARKLEFSRRQPKASRLFLSEILQGAPVLGPVLKGRVKEMADEKAGVLRDWAGEGKIADVDPYHLIFAIWAITQHYADFETQIKAVLPPGQRSRDKVIAEANRTVTEIFLNGLLPRT